MYTPFIIFFLSLFIATDASSSLKEQESVHLKSCLKKTMGVPKTVSFDDNMFVIFFRNIKQREVLEVEEAYKRGIFSLTRKIKKKGSRFDYLVPLNEEERKPELWDLERPMICIKGCPKRKISSATDDPEVFLQKASSHRMDVIRLMAEINHIYGHGRQFIDLALAQRAVAFCSLGQIGYSKTLENEQYFKQQFKSSLFGSLENYVRQAQVTSSVEMFHLVSISFVKNVHAIGHAVEKEDEFDYLDATIAEVGKFSSFMLLKIHDYHKGNKFDCENEGCPDCQYIVDGIEHFRLAYH